MKSTPWCRVCCTRHPREGRCAGDLHLTGQEFETAKVVAETPAGMQGYGVLVAEAGTRFRSRILTFPNVIWTVPGGSAAMKFVGRSQQEAVQQAVAFIRRHCQDKGYTLRDEIESVEPLPRLCKSRLQGQRNQDVAPHNQRFLRDLPVRFGRNRPTLLARTGNLSESGLFVATHHPLMEGELVGMMLEMEHCKVPLRGSVMWSRPEPVPGLRPGMGLKLLNPPKIYVRYVQALD